MDLALNNLQRLMCHKPNQTKPNQFISIQNNKLHGFPFKEFNALSYSSLQRFYALLEGFLRDASQLLCYSSLDGLHAFETATLDDPLFRLLSLGKRKKLHRAKSGEQSGSSSTLMFHYQLWCLVSRSY